MSDKRFSPTIEQHGPAATHDMPCCVHYHGDPKPAILDMNTGVFHPSWEARANGWRLVRANTRFKRWLVRRFLLEEHKRPPKDYSATLIMLTVCGFALLKWWIG